MTQAHKSVAEVAKARAIGSKFLGPQKVLFVVNNDASFLSHRASWAGAYMGSGAEVSLFAEDTGFKAAVAGIGVRFTDVSVGRESSNPIRMLIAAVRLFWLMARLRPHLVFLSASTAYTLGWPYAIFARRTQFVRVVGGAGRAIVDGKPRGASGRVVQFSAALAARLANVQTLFQTTEDARTFAILHMAVPSRSVVIPSTGIDCDEWLPRPKHVGPVKRVLFASRLYREKGIYEFVELAELDRDSDRQYLIAGSPDTGLSSSVTTEELDSWREAGLVTYLGRRLDMDEVLASSDVIVFPSRHPEGTPRILIEAAACRVPAITTNLAGCRAVTRHDESGIIVSDCEPETLLRAIEVLDDDSTRDRMGEYARRYSEDNFSLEAILPQVLEAFGSVRSR